MSVNNTLVTEAFLNDGGLGLSLGNVATSLSICFFRRRRFSCKVEYLSEYMRDFNMTLMQKTEMKRHFNFKLEFNSVSLVFTRLRPRYI